MDHKKRKRDNATMTEDPRRAKIMKTTDVSATISLLLPPDAPLYRIQDFVSRFSPSLEPLDFEKVPRGVDIGNMIIHPYNPDGLQCLASLRRVDCRESLVDLVDRVVCSLVRRKTTSHGGQRNVLDQGYNQATSHEFRCHQTVMSPGIVCSQINDNVSFCKTSSFCRTLHSLVGDRILHSLLLHTSLFVPIPNNNRGNYFLLCGPPLSPFRRRQQSETKGTSNHHWRANDCISRHSLFYSGSYVPKIGLPDRHILQRRDSTPKQLLDSMVGLRTPQRKGRMRRKRWNRVRTGLDICQQILARHRQCDYPRLLNRYCPLPDFCQQDRTTTVDLAQVGATYTPSSQVGSFLCAIIRQVFPLEFVGSQRNMDRLMDSVKTFVSLRRDEGFPHKAFLQGMRITDVAWVWGGKDRDSAPKKRSPSDHQAAINTVTTVLRWLFCQYILPLLRSLFYVTETEFGAKFLMYYRKPVWSIFRTKSMELLLSRQYRELSQEAVTKRLQSQEMGFSRLKLLPKKTGMRPVAMLSKREFVPLEGGRHSREDVKFQSTNAKLAKVFEVLRHEQQRQPSLLGAGVLGLNEFYPMYRNWVRHSRKQLSDKGSRLYFATVDVHRCYDNIHQEHLLRVVGDILSEDEYLIQKHSAFHSYRSMRGIATKRLRRVGSPETYQSFHDMVVEASQRRNNTVFTKGQGSSVIQQETILKMLDEHIRSHLVVAPGRYGDRFLIQSTGIPQGSVLSTLLCNFYFGSVEKQLLPLGLVSSVSFTHAGMGSKGILVRLVDDFLLITTEKHLAVSFVERMHKGIEKLGVRINSAKTMTNFGVQDLKADGLTTIAGKKFFPWCGLLFDAESGEVRVDYSRFQDNQAVASLTVDRTEEGRQLEVRMKSFVRPRCQCILFDRNINGRKTMIINFTELMLFCATKTAEYIKSGLDPDQNLSFLLRCIDGTTDYAIKLIEERSAKENPKNYLRISRSDATWLGRFSFKTIFRQRLPTVRIPLKSSWMKDVATQAADQFVD